MKDYTTNNANPALPPQWNDCRTCGAGITRKTDASQQCRNCREAQAMRDSRKIFEEYDQLDREVFGGYGFGRNNKPSEWGYGDADCSSTGGWG